MRAFWFAIALLIPVAASAQESVVFQSCSDSCTKSDGGSLGCSAMQETESDPKAECDKGGRNGVWCEDAKKILACNCSDKPDSFEGVFAIPAEDCKKFVKP